jgi:hypothetical protein
MLPPSMDDTDHAPFPGFSADLVFGALGRYGYGASSVQQYHAGSAIWSQAIANSLPLDDDTVLAAATSDPLG